MRDPSPLPRTLVALAASILMVALGCERSPAKPSGGGGGAVAPPVKAPPLPPSLSARLSQRTEVHLPEDRPVIVVAIGDISGGAVSMVIDTVEGESLLEPRMMHEGETVEFLLGGFVHALTMQELDNRVIGEDFARFEIRRVGVISPPGASSGESTGLESPDGGATGKQAPGASARASAGSAAAGAATQIEALIALVGSQENIRFLRNGIDYSAAEAADHLRRKWRAAGSRVRTVEEFIEHCGTRSSQSGAAYMVRFSDGREIECRAFLLELLGRSRSAP